MNSLELIAKIEAELRRTDTTLDKIYDSGLLRAMWIIRESTQGDVEYCPRCEKIAKLFEVEG